MSIHHHFRPEEQPLVEQAQEWLDHAVSRHQSKRTDFLDPREQFIVQSLVGSSADVHVSFFGGYEQAERKRAFICPEYVKAQVEDYQVALLSIEGKFPKPLEHRDVLGSILNLGVKREKFGDLLLTDDDQQIIVAEEMAGFVQLNLNQINHYNVSCSLLSIEQIQIPKNDWNDQSSTVSSLRLDSIMAEMIRLSRSKVIPFIKSGKVKVNWKVEETPSVIIEEGDTLSIKGYGRFLFKSVEGMTKKKKYRIKWGKKE